MWGEICARSGSTLGLPALWSVPWLLVGMTCGENVLAQSDAPLESARTDDTGDVQREDEAPPNSPQRTEDSEKAPAGKDAEKGFHGFSLLPLPVLATTPATGWMIGVAPTANWMMGHPETTRRSSLVSSVIYTTKKQLLITVKFNMFLDGDRWNLLGDWRYFDTSQPTYGLGTGSPSATLASSGIRFNDKVITNGIDEAQMMMFKYLRIHQTVLRRLGESYFFFGAGYHLDYHFDIDDQLLELDEVPPTVTSHYAYSVSRGIDPEGYVLSGVSVNALYDTRDNPINPYNGRYGLVTVRGSPKFLGSDANSGHLWLEYRDYFGLQKKHPRHLLAVWGYGSFALGDRVPYLDLPALGWDFFGRSGRAYAQGRFRGQALLYSEVEYRFPLPLPLPLLRDRLGGVAFVNATTASNQDAGTHLFKYVDPGWGSGLRFLFNKRSRANLTLDYAWGLYGAQGLYLNANETF